MTAPVGGRWRTSVVLVLAVSLCSVLGSATAARAGAATTSSSDTTGGAAVQAAIFEGWQPPASSTRQGTPDPTMKLDVIFVLRLQPSHLLSLVESVSDPGTPTYRQYKSIPWLAHHAGATEATIRSVLGELRSKGIDGRLDPTASYVEAAITIRKASALFRTSFGKYLLLDADGSTTGVAPRSPPRLPTSLAGDVSAVLGLDQDLAEYPIQQPPLEVPATEQSLYSSTTGTMGTPGGCRAGRSTPGPAANQTVDLLTPQQYLTAYGVEHLHARGLTGRGQAVAILSVEPGDQGDLRTFTRCFGLATPTIENVPVGLGTPTELDDQQAHGEVSLDTQMVAAMAPGLTDIDVITARNFSPVSLVDLFDAPLDRARFHGPMPKVVSFSGGACEVGGFGDQSYAQFPLAYGLDEHLLMDEAANGISVVAASGDWGSTCSTTPDPGDRSLAQLSVLFPASSPFVTGVGGSVLGLNADDTIKSEQAWSDLPLGVGMAGGGGQSAASGRPWYQASLDLPGNGRLVPDVALEGAVYPGPSIASYCTSGCSQSGWTVGGGTSAAAPLLAGGLALADQSAASRHQASLGLVNPLLYQLGAAGSKALVDITQGSIDVYGLGCCTARPGYDEATGWGSVNSPQFVEAADAAATSSSKHGDG